ncbi:hypothetical protein DOTSEDRAFT_25880 [Dothistroma septosporum NZE10]|uniref:Uncharacterized protein n=1 Tax=Dothistroma septosporum (strain NZE10 / CBS 128990) TaxID=675120 RepID=N1PLS5_DOTSN|nr:hypothetical protein DOTSEDRAFT_25880 [Dothistroma septosporum NZE10]
MADPIDVDRDIIHRPISIPTQPTTSTPSFSRPEEETVPLGTGTTDEEVDAAAALMATISEGKRKLSLGKKMIAKTAINYGKLRQQAHKEAAHDLWIRGVKNFGERAMREMWEQVREVQGF